MKDEEWNALFDLYDSNDGSIDVETARNLADKGLVEEMSQPEAVSNLGELNLTETGMEVIQREKNHRDSNRQNKNLAALTAILAIVTALEIFSITYYRNFKYQQDIRIISLLLILSSLIFYFEATEVVEMIKRKLGGSRN